MRLERVAWLLPAITVATIVAQVAYLLETRQLSWTVGILVGVLDILFVLLVVRLFHALRRDEPLTLSNGVRPANGAKMSRPASVGRVRGRSGLGEIREPGPSPAPA